MYTSGKLDPIMFLSPSNKYLCNNHDYNKPNDDDY